MPEGVAARLSEYSEAWSNLATKGLTPFWAEDRFRFYKAEEISGYFTSWQDVIAYWDGNEILHEKVSLRFSEVQEIELPGMALVGITKMHWDIRFSADVREANGAPFPYGGKAMGGINHVLTIWEEVDGVLKLTGWSETPDAPITYMADLYYAATTPGF